MIWVVGCVGYVLAVVAIVRFFQFVSTTDRSIGELLTSQTGIRKIKPSSMKPGVRQRRVGTRKLQQV